MAGYIQSAVDDAKEFAQHLLEQIIEQLVDGGEASDDYNNDYLGADRYFNESYVDRSYSLQESAELLHELRDFEETDNGLWEGLQPEDAIASKAVYTYGNAVGMIFRSLIEEINEYEWDTVTDFMSDCSAEIIMYRKSEVNIPFSVEDLTQMLFEAKLSYVIENFTYLGCS
jgi:hypothetical protein